VYSIINQHLVDSARFVRSKGDFRAKLPARFVRSAWGGSCEALCQVRAKLVGGSCEAPWEVRAKLVGGSCEAPWEVQAASLIFGGGRGCVVRWVSVASDSLNNFGSKLILDVRILPNSMRSNYLEIRRFSLSFFSFV